MRWRHPSVCLSICSFVRLSHETHAAASALLLSPVTGLIVAVPSTPLVSSMFMCFILLQFFPVKFMLAAAACLWHS